MKVDILGIKIDNITMQQALKKCEGMYDGAVHYIFTPNPEIIMEGQCNEFRDILNSADMLLPDGIGVVIASKLLKQPISSRVPGFEFVSNLLKTGKSFYLFGGKPGIAEKAQYELSKQGVNVVGNHNGYFKDDTYIIEDINSKKPDILLVCLGAPKQEKWVFNNKDKLSVSICIGAGGSLDVLSGEAKRAPLIFQKLYLEWLYRALKQPQRLPRLLKLPQFLLKVFFEKGKRR